MTSLNSGSLLSGFTRSWCWKPSDLDTPLSVYPKLNRPWSYLLESVQGWRALGRYSSLGFLPKPGSRSRSPLR
jgi:hypothetical protein